MPKYVDISSKKSLYLNSATNKYLNIIIDTMSKNRTRIIEFMIIVV